MRRDPSIVAHRTGVVSAPSRWLKLDNSRTERYASHRRLFVVASDNLAFGVILRISYTKGADVTSKEMNLSGPVKTVTSEEGSGDFRSWKEWRFDRSGRLLRRSGRTSDGREWHNELRYGPGGETIERGLHRLRNADGSSVQTQAVSHLDAWSMKGLHDFFFATYRAASAKTCFDKQGAPIETVFLDSSGREVAKVLYECDERALIREARQYGPTLSMFSRTDAQVSLSEAPIQHARLSFEYDSMDRLIKSELDEFGELAVSAMSYNEGGDLLTWTVNNQTVSYRYEYDHRGNWIVKETDDDTGIRQEFRRITYYDDDE